jgi:hypothetical protein
LFAVAVSTACGSEPRGAPVPRVLSDPSTHLVHIGLDESAPADATIGRVIAARMTEGGRHVVVLDFVAPFVKVFDREGRLHSAFLRRGRGPGESRGPVALAAAGDSLLLVANSSEGVSVFTLSGELKAHARIPGLVPLAATSWCGGEWLIYGPRISAGVGRAAWLHRLRTVSADSIEVVSMLTDTVPTVLPSGLVYGLVRDGDAAVLRHVGGGRSRVFRAGCGGGEPRLVHEGEPSAATDGPKDLGGGKVSTTIRVGMRFPGGVAAVGDRVVIGEKVHMGQGRQRLDLVVIDGSGAAPAGSIAGNFALRDSKPGVGVLVSSNDPVPQLFIVRSADFLKILRKP